ncbi:MAG: hypothetical protein RLO81_00185 [Fulvivirga sp.]|uniref:hypothetical protein n=1 Tax=Fulvivirga sp. TaxID=1931237 RepID=UPI0032EC61DC
MFEEFPKVREELPTAYKEIYESHYHKNREGETAATSVSQKMEQWLHKKVAADLKGAKDKSTLEIGAGTLNQLKFENTQPYDIIEPFKSLFEDSPKLSKIRNVYDDIKEVPTDQKYDRITSVATFEHVCDLPDVVAKSCIHLNEGGSLRVAIPNEGTIMWTMGWKLTTGLEYKLKYGLDYSVLMKYEHVNNAKEIEEVISYFYQDIKCSVFGISKGLAFYRFYECKKPNLAKAEDYLNGKQ